MTIHLRDYQEEALAAEARHRAEVPDETRLAIVLPTGAGKTITFAERARRHVRAEQDRVLILVHTDELAQQAEAKVHLMATQCVRCASSGWDPEDVQEVCWACRGSQLSVGVVKAERDETAADIIIGSVQTLANPERRARITDVGLVIVDECFPAGTLVGGNPIETLKPGDMVPSWDERTGTVTSRPVVALMSKRPSSMVRVTLDDGQAFACTPNHPILTDSGWCPAGGLWRGASVISFTHDATAIGSVHGMSGSDHPDCQGEDRRVPAIGPDVLLGSVPGRMGEAGPFGADGAYESSARLGADEAAQSDDSAREQSQDVRDLARDRAQAASARGKRHSDYGAAEAVSPVPGMADRSGYRASGRGAAVSLPGGHCTSVDEGGDRGGWGVPFLAGPPSLRPSQGGTPRFSRVVAVQILEPGSDGTYGGVCPDGLVYNIEVADTHTYLVGDVVVHNCHHATAASYQAIMRHFGCFGVSRCFKPGRIDDVCEDGCVENCAFSTPALGFTATLERGDGQGLGEVWQDVAYSKDVAWGVRKGHLVQPIGYRLEIELDSTQTPDRFVASNAAALDEQMVEALAPARIVEKWLELARDRPTVAFMPLVRSAELLAETFADAGIDAAVVHGDLNPIIRRQILSNYENGLTQVLVNAMVLTEGWDSPRTSCVIVGRPTKSRSLFVQMAGRGLRPVPGIPVEDQDCILIAVADATTDLCSIADLSDRPLPRTAEGALTAMEDAWDIGKALDEQNQAKFWTGHVDAHQFDPIVQRSSKVWRTTEHGTPFLPISKDGEYVFVVGTSVFLREVGGRFSKVLRLHKDLPDLELAMTLAEQEAEDRGGDLGRLLADRNRPWRKLKPSVEMINYAMYLGLGPQVDKILSARAGGKAGRISDLIAKVQATRALEPMVKRIKEATA